MGGLIPVLGFAFSISAAATFIVAVVSTVTYFRNVHLLFEYLRTHYPRAWKALGEPHPFWNNSLRTNAAFAAVLDGNVSEEISDQKVVHMLRKTKRLYSITSASFTVSLTCMLAVSIFTNL